MKKLLHAVGKHIMNPGYFFASAGVYLAQWQGPQQDQGINNPFFRNLGQYFGTNNAPAGSPVAATTVGGLIAIVVQMLLLVAGSIAVVFLMIGGYRYVTAHGNEEAAESAKKTITSALIGLVVVVLAFAIVTIITNVLLQGNLGV